MATMRLVPSTYEISNTTYVTVTDPENMYTNTDSTTYASLRNTRSSTSSTYYVYIRGFNFDDLPADAVVSSFSVKLRGYESYMSTSSSYRMSLYHGTTAISNTTVTASFSTTNTTFTFPNGALDWDDVVGYGSTFGIRVPLRRSSTSYSSYIYVYGAEIEVTYTIPIPRTITSTLSGSGTISPSGATTLYDDDEYTLTITPTNISDEVIVKNNDTDVTEDLVVHHTGGTSSSKSTASGSGVTTGFARSGGAFYQSSSTQSDAWLRYAIGHTAESPYSTSNTSNTYCKDGTNDATTEGWMNYPFDFSSLPDDAEITSITVKVYGAAESTSETARHADVSLWCGSTQKGTTQSFSSTSNSTMTLSDPGEWTREDLQDAWLRFGVGYYGGRILGITWTVNYTTGGTVSHYTYTYTVNGDATIAVTIGNGPTNTIYFKNNGTWTAATKVYKKINGSWVQQTDLTTVFSSSVNYVQGG